MTLRQLAEQLADSDYSFSERWVILLEYIQDNPAEGFHATLQDILPAFIEVSPEEIRVIEQMVNEHLDELGDGLPPHPPGTGYNEYFIIYGGTLVSPIGFVMN